MNIDLLGAGALLVVSLEWLALGWLSGVQFPSPTTSGQVPTWALRLLVGAVLVASAQLLLAVVGIAFGAIPVALLVAAVGAAALRTLGRGGGCSTKQPPSVDWREGAGWLLLGTLLLVALVRSLTVPESGWDAFSHWGLRAQAFAQAQMLVDAHSEHEYYPPLVPLLEAWLYLHRGLVSIDLGKTVWAVIGGAFAIVLGWQLRISLGSARWAAPYLALGIVLATALLDGFWTGQADLMLTACLTLATLAAWQWQQSTERAWLVQAVIFAAAAALTKFEGLPRILLLVVALAVEAAIARPRPPRSWLPVACLIGSGVLGWLVWTAFEVTHAIAPNAEHIGPFQPLAIGGVLAALLAVFGGVRTGGGVLVAAAGWVCAAPTILRPPLRALVLVSVAQALGTLVAFLVSATAPDVEVLTSATRLVEQFMPVALFVAAVGLARTGHL